MRVALNGMLLGPCNTGVGNYIESLARGLDRICRARASIEIFHPRGYGQARKWRTLKSRTVGLRSRSRGVRIGWEQAMLPLALRSGYDALHAPAYVAPLKAPVPVVLTVHDLIALEQPALCARANALHYRLLMPPSIRSAARIIVPTEWVRSRLIRRFPEVAAKTRVIPEGVRQVFRMSPLPGELDPVRHRFGIRDRSILFAGNIEPKKNLGALLAAFDLLKSRFRDLQLVVCGRLGWKCAKLHRTLRERSRSGDAIVTGYVQTPVLRALYRCATVFAFPSLIEGFGVPPLEAMACGTPVVASATPAVAEVVGNGGLTVEPTDIRGLAAALGAVLESAAMRSELRERGYARCRQFTWSRAAARTLEVYHEAALTSQ